MIPDIINSTFEFVGGVLCWVNVLRLLRDREVKGVYWPATAFFAVWGTWNLVYYPMLGQWCSFVGGVFLVVGNAAWVILAWRFERAGRSGSWEFERLKKRILEERIE